LDYQNNYIRNSSNEMNNAKNFNILVISNYFLYLKKKDGKNSFAKISKTLAKCRSENNFVG